MPLALIPYNKKDIVGLRVYEELRKEHDRCKEQNLPMTFDGSSLGSIARLSETLPSLITKMRQNDKYNLPIKNNDGFFHQLDYDTEINLLQHIKENGKKKLTNTKIYCIRLFLQRFPPNSIECESTKVWVDKTTAEVFADRKLTKHEYNQEDPRVEAVATALLSSVSQERAANYRSALKRLSNDIPRIFHKFLSEFTMDDLDNALKKTRKQGQRISSKDGYIIRKYINFQEAYLAASTVALDQEEGSRNIESPALRSGASSPLTDANSATEDFGRKETLSPPPEPAPFAWDQEEGSNHSVLASAEAAPNPERESAFLLLTPVARRGAWSVDLEANTIPNRHRAARTKIVKVVGQNDLVTYLIGMQSRDSATWDQGPFKVPKTAWVGVQEGELRPLALTLDGPIPMVCNTRSADHFAAANGLSQRWPDSMSEDVQGRVERLTRRHERSENAMDVDRPPVAAPSQPGWDRVPGVGQRPRWDRGPGNRQAVASRDGDPEVMQVDLHRAAGSSRPGRGGFGH